MSITNRRLRVFLCHASQDKTVVRELYQRLLAKGWIDPWLDEEKLLPGQDWNTEIEKAVEVADIVIVCLSNHSITKEGYIQKEIKKVLDVADEKPEGSIFVIPLRIDDSQIPRRLRMWQWLDYFKDNAYEKLEKSLTQRFESLGEKVPSNSELPVDLYKFVYFPAGQIPGTKQYSSYPFWISKYPVTNLQYERFLRDPYFDPLIGLKHKGVAPWDNRDYWGDIPMFEKDRAESKRTDLDSGNAGRKWIEEQLTSFRRWYNPDGKEYMILPDQNDPEGRRVNYPHYWGDPDFGIARKNVPVVGVTWYEASAYCKWLEKNWNSLEESKVNREITWPSQIWIRLPTRNEWEVAAGGKYPSERYPWDKPNEFTRDVREIFSRANVAYQIGKTTPVDKYPNGASPRGVVDMSGNVWEWLSNIFHSGESIVKMASLDVSEDDIPSYSMMEMTGGSWARSENEANLSGRNVSMPDEEANDRGFRVVIAKM